MGSEHAEHDEVERHALEGTLIEPSERALSSEQAAPATLEELAAAHPEIREMLEERGLVALLDSTARTVGLALSELTLQVSIPQEEIENLFHRLVEHFEGRLGAARSSGSEDQWMDLDQAAAYMGVSKNHIYKLRTSGRLPKHGSGARKGRQLKSELDEWLRSNAER